ncbi:MAG: hypothetical protein H6772_04050 [Pseudomonadales bacterium]|nr:hypothetical protein [Pseudomonadales bacterium]
MPNDEISVESQPVAEKPKLKEQPLPPHWTYLIHGSNLEKPQWQGDGVDQLDGDMFIIKGSGLSVIDKADKEMAQQEAEEMRARGIKTGGYNTTSNYSRGRGTPLEIRVIFPSFNSRSPLTKEQRAELVKKYGEEIVQALYELADMVHWNNYKSGRHPFLPKGMKLSKIMDQTLEERRIIQYVPEMIFNIYQQEVAK